MARMEQATAVHPSGNGSRPVVSWIAFTPVKGLRLRQLREATLTQDGIPGDRAFFLADERGFMVSSVRLGSLLAVSADYEHETRTLTLTFADRGRLAAPVELGEPERVRFGSRELHARPVRGAFSTALSDHCGKPLRLFATPSERPGVDRGRNGAVTLLSTASLDRLRAQAGQADPVDPRRFRMTLGVDGVAAHEEDDWVGHELGVGEARLEVAGNVGRCALTTRDPDSGVVDFQTLHHLGAYRGDVQASEPLPFGVYARVTRRGTVRVGDTVALDAEG